MQRKWYLIAIGICLAISFACLAYPLYVIRPFRAQGVNELAVALVVLQIRGIVTVLCVLIAIAAAVRYWLQQPRIGRRIAMVSGAVITCVFAVLCRVNVYEQMFHPNSRPAFSEARQAKLDKDEKVIAVRQGSAARAYPIRNIAYHHVINDVVGGVPIVATY